MTLFMVRIRHSPNEESEGHARRDEFHDAVDPGRPFSGMCVSPPSMCSVSNQRRLRRIHKMRFRSFRAREAHIVRARAKQPFGVSVIGTPT